MVTDTLRRRDVFVSKSAQWGDPRAQLLGPSRVAVFEMIIEAVKRL